MYARLEQGGLVAPWKVLLCCFLPSLVAFIGMDVCWIVLVASAQFQEVLAGLMRPQPDVASGLLAWCAIVGGTLHFAGARALTRTHAALQGALLGVCIYATYELTNLSIISSWTWALALMDTAWGSFACCVAAVLQQSLLVWLQS